MSAPDFSRWTKSSRSNPSGNCVEVGFSPDATDGGTLTASAAKWAGFLVAVTSGRLDRG